MPADRRTINDEPLIVSQDQPLRDVRPPAAPVTNPVTNPADDVARALRRHWPITALVAATITLLAWIFAAAQPKRYEATAIAAITPVQSQMSPSDLIRGVDSLDRRVVVSSVAALASTPRTAREAGAAADDRVDAAVLPSTNLFRMTVEGRNPAHVAAVANALPRLLDAQSRDIFAVYGVVLVSPATAPSKPSLPRVSRAVAAGLILGLLAGTAVAYLIDRGRLRFGARAAR